MKAQDIGWDAFFNGLTHNPFPAGSVKRTYWAKGWEKAKKHAWPLTLSNFQPARTIKDVN